jgi:hypothetical protein
MILGVKRNLLEGGLAEKDVYPADHKGIHKGHLPEIEAGEMELCWIR